MTLKASKVKGDKLHEKDVQHQLFSARARNIRLVKCN